MEFVLLEASMSPSCVLYPLLSHSGPRPPLSAHCGGGWGLAAARPMGFCPACVPDPGKEREGECGGVSRWLVPRGSSPAGLQAASLGWSIRAGPSCSQVLCSLYIRVVCQPKGNSDCQTPGGLGSCHPPTSRPSEAASIT